MSKSRPLSCLAASVATFAVAALSSCAPLADRPSLDYPPLPLVYEDAGTRTVFYVETDRRHVAALREGKLLWIRDMTSVTGRDEGFGRVDGIGKMPNNQTPGYVGISFNTGEFGRFRESDGKLVDEGCD